MDSKQTPNYEPTFRELPDTGPSFIPPDFTRAHILTHEMEDEIDAAFAYKPWDAEQISAGNRVRQALARAVKVIVADVPPGPDRTVAIRKIREARMDANSAITHGGKY